nr:DsaO [Streptomyces scopuliridis]
MADTAQRTTTGGTRAGRDPGPARPGRGPRRTTARAVLAALIVVPAMLGMAACEGPENAKSRGDACEKILAKSTNFSDTKDPEAAEKELKDLADEIAQLAEDTDDEKLREAAKELRSVSPGGRDPDSVGEIISETTKRIKIIRNTCISFG